jgi:effector-binding domain-containing protein
MKLITYYIVNNDQGTPTFACVCSEEDFAQKSEEIFKTVSGATATKISSVPNMKYGSLRIKDGHHKVGDVWEDEFKWGIKLSDTKEKYDIIRL